MARDLSPVVKQSRREGYALHPKAHKYLAKRPGIPGQHGGNGRRLGSKSQYALQLREKQKVRRLYGLLEKQFKNLFTKAAKQRGQTGENAMIMLERRLDNVLYRAGFASSRRAARQLAGHGHFMINDQRVDIPSYQVSIGDAIVVRTKSSKNDYFKILDDVSPKPSNIPSWLKVDRKKLSIDVKSLPTREDVEPDINEQLIVEYYSR
ncbi:MAG: 30S ribosomal protein S4 [Patescibacteria group bacterium]